MKRNLIAALALLVAGVAVAGQYNSVVAIGAPMPSFAALPATDGTMLSSKDLHEDVVVLVFLASHCPWVNGMDADLVKLAGEMKGKSVRFIGIALNHRDDDRLPAMKEHAKKKGYNFTYVYDELQTVGRALGATRTPEYFVFDNNRKLVYMGAIHDSPAHMTADGGVLYTKGEPKTFYVRDAILATLAGQPVKVAETRAQGCTLEYDTPR